MIKNDNLPVLYAPYVQIPWGVSKNHIVLKDPYDLRPAADLIAEATLKRWADQGLGTHFTVAMGEYHDRASHKMLQMMTMSRLAQLCSSLTAAFECPANLVSENLCEKSPESEITPDEYYALIELDHDLGGAVNLLTALQESADAHAPVTKTLLFNNCLENGYGTRFVDTARPYQGGGLNPYIRTDDPVVIEFLEKAFCEGPEGYSKIHVTSPLGVSIRNYSMMVRSDQYETSGMTVLSAGMAHLMGDRELEYNRAHSLEGFYKDNGIAFFPVLLEWDKDTPVERDDDMIVIEGLSQNGFTPQGDDGSATIYAEIKEIEKMDAASGRECDFNVDRVFSIVQQRSSETTAVPRGLELLSNLRQQNKPVPQI